MDRISTLYRAPKLDDIVSLVQTGKPVEALFAMKGTAWVHNFLHGILYKDSDFRWLDSKGADWDDCRIYDPPEWFKNKPDPGEGWRLLEKFPPEELQSGFDQVYHVESQSWLGVATISSEQKETVWYRRRIEPVAQCPEPSPSIDNNVSVLCEVKLPVPCSVLGAITESLSKEYPGATMRQVGKHLRFERRIDDWNDES